MRAARLGLAAFLLACAVALPLTASANVADAASTFSYTKNMKPLGYSPRVVPLVGAGSGIFNSDLAFWGKTAVQGSYEGFRLVDVSDPEDPAEIVNFTGCVQGTTTGNQGDVIVWDSIVVRSWNSPAPASGATCGGVFTPPGQGGLHVFDVSDPAHPVGLTFVPTPCGSHTATGVPDLANARLLVYNSPSSGAVGCRGLDIIQIPLANPSKAVRCRRLGQRRPRERRGGRLEHRRLRTVRRRGRGGRSRRPRQLRVSVEDTECAERWRHRRNRREQRRRTCHQHGGTNPAIVIPAVMVSLADGTAIRAGLPATGRVHTPVTPDRSCHDTGVILGAGMKVACAGGDGLSVWTIDPSEGGSLVDPKILYSRSLTGVTVGHSASFTWDGKVLIFGHEPGGGSQARCQATSAEVDRTLFFIDAATGQTIGTFIHPRPQSATENCTWHNDNVVPTDGRYILVSGNYQSGISVVDFTDPANAREIAFADPAPLVNPTNPNAIVAGGDWSSYWYDGRIYESDMKRGLIIWNLADRAVAGARKLGHLNPQTQEFTLD